MGRKQQELGTTVRRNLPITINAFEAFDAYYQNLPAPKPARGQIAGYIVEDWIKNNQQEG